VEDRLEALVQAETDTLPRPIGSSVGTITHRHDLIQDYMDFIAGTVPVDFSGLKVVVDCSHGAAYEVAPLLLKRLGADVIVMNNQPTGININDHCGSTHLEGLQKAVLEHHADIGIAHDGDADRCLAIDEEGQVIDGDQIMVMCTLNLMKEGKLKDNTLVATVMSNIGLHKAIKQAGGKVLVTPVGDRYVLETMVEKGLVLGGEQSGHIIFGDYNTTGDGVLTALQLITAVKSSGKKLSELGKLMTKFPQLLVNVRVKSQIGWQENAAISAAVAAGEAELGDSGRILVRSSGTEPLIRVMAEGPCQTELKRIVNNIADVVKSELV
jgi:phosphoglucosamine mutase